MRFLNFRLLRTWRTWLQSSCSPPARPLNSCARWRRPCPWRRSTNSCDQSQGECTKGDTEIALLSAFLYSRPWDKDRFMSPDIEAVTNLLRDGKIWSVVRHHVDFYHAPQVWVNFHTQGTSIWNLGAKIYILCMCARRFKLSSLKILTEKTYKTGSFRFIYLLLHILTKSRIFFCFTLCRKLRRVCSAQRPSWWEVRSARRQKCAGARRGKPTTASSDAIKIFNHSC